MPWVPLGFNVDHMFSWLKRRRAKVKLRRQFAQYLPADFAASLAISFEPRHVEADLVLVLIDCSSESESSSTFSKVIGHAVVLEGTILSILGPMVLVGFGVPAPLVNSAQFRSAFVERLVEKGDDLSLRVVHGRWRALLGNFGGEGRWSYTAVPFDFSILLGKLAGLQPGQALEHVV